MSRGKNRFSSLDNPGVNQPLITYLRNNNNNRQAINTLRQVNKNFKNSLDSDFMFMQKYINKKPGNITINDWMYIKPYVIYRNEQVWFKQEYGLYNAFWLYAMYRGKYNYRIALDNMITDIASGPGVPRWMWRANPQYYKDRQTKAIIEYTRMTNNKSTSLQDFYNWIYEYISLRTLSELGI
jgi:hypothetical protein